MVLLDDTDASYRPPGQSRRSREKNVSENARAGPSTRPTSESLKRGDKTSSAPARSPKDVVVPLISVTSTRPLQSVSTNPHGLRVHGAPSPPIVASSLDIFESRVPLAGLKTCHSSKPKIL